MLKSILLKIGYNSKSTKRASLSELLVVQCFRVEMRRVAELSRLLLPAAIGTVLSLRLPNLALY